MTSHMLMSAGVVAAIGVGQWTTAVLIVFFMRFGEWMEALTTGRSRQALRQLVAMQPPSARVFRDGAEVEVPIERAAVGEVVVVRPGERIPVDGEVVDGQAPVVVLASVGAAARRGLLIKGGAVLEQLARVDTVVVDKTGPLTRGEPRVTDVVTLNGLGARLAALTPHHQPHHQAHPDRAGERG